MTQTTLDLNAVLKRAEPPKPGTIRTVVVTNVTQQRAQELFGKGAKEPDKQVYGIFANIDGVEQHIAAYAVPYDIRRVSPKSNLERFRARYGTYPMTGLKVEIEATAKAYWRIKLD